MRKKIILFGIGGVFLLFFILYGPPAMIEKTSTSEFCSTCHVHDEHYGSWVKTGLHRSVSCVQCHLPHTDPATHLFWKGIDGGKDFLLFHTNLFKEPLKLGDHGKSVLKNNCISCHKDMVSQMTLESKNCWDCHKRVNHKTAGLVTRKIKLQKEH